MNEDTTINVLIAYYYARYKVDRCTTHGLLCGHNELDFPSMITIHRLEVMYYYCTGAILA